MLNGTLPEGMKNRASITGNIFISNNCLSTDLTGVLGTFLDVNAVERPFSGE
jgi:hypothetical protein